MPNSRSHEIESWFQDHADGEFAILPAEHRTTVIGEPSRSRTILYTTKVAVLSAHLHAFPVAQPIAVLGRYGLPVMGDLVHFDGVPADTRCYFVGDADPPDILAFAWLREHAAMHWLGVGDWLLHRETHTDWSTVEIAISDGEKAALRVLPDLCPDYRDLLGAHCSSVLDRGFKIELEGAFARR